MSELETLFSAQQIQKRTKELGQQITADYKGKEIVAIGILNGGFIFMADLVRAIDLQVHCEFMRIASYYDGKESTGKIELILDIKPEKIKNKDVLIVEDIIDTGRSMKFLREHLQKCEPASLKLCSFLFKEAALIEPCHIDYLGYKVDPLFVVGYGLDYAGKYRNYPEIAVLKE